MPKNSPSQKPAKLYAVGTQEASKNLESAADLGNTGGSGFGNDGEDPMIADLRSRVTRLEGALVALGLMLLFAVGGLYLYIGSKIEGVNGRFEAVDSRFESINDKIADIRVSQAGTDAKLDAIIERLPAKH